jgi:myo-inositol catabolism protein IolS
VQPDVFPRVFEVVQELKEVAAKYGKTPGQTGLRWRVLRWLLDQEGITAVSVGVSKPEQVDENLGALD